MRNILNDIQKATSAAVLATEQGSKAVEAGSQTVRTSRAIDSGALAVGVAEAGAGGGADCGVQPATAIGGVDQWPRPMENIKQASAQNLSSARQAAWRRRRADLNELGAKSSNDCGRYKTLTIRFQVRKISDRAMPNGKKNFCKVCEPPLKWRRWSICRPFRRACLSLRKIAYMPDAQRAEQIENLSRHAPQFGARLRGPLILGRLKRICQSVGKRVFANGNARESSHAAAEGVRHVASRG